jgi:probable HAF family extracellular repeat protein
MYTIELRPALAPASFGCADKTLYSRFGRQIALALCTAPFVWGQTPPVSKGPHLLPTAPTAASTRAAVSATETRYKFVTISPPNSPYAVADGINDAGVVTGYYQDPNSNYHGFVWSEGKFHTVDYPGAAYTLLYGVSNTGVAIGYYNDGTADHVVTYSVDGGTWESLPDIPNYPLNQGYCINNGSVAVGNAYQGTTPIAWIWDPSKSSYSFFVAPGAAANSTFPSCINDRNEIAGYYIDSNGVYHGFLSAYGAYTTIDVPSGADTFPDGINNLGTIQGQIVSASGALEGFIATVRGIFEIVNYPGAIATAIVGINDRGDLCGSEGGTNFANAKAFLAIVKR